MLLLNLVLMMTSAHAGGAAPIKEVNTFLDGMPGEYELLMGSKDCPELVKVFTRERLLQLKNLEVEDNPTYPSMGSKYFSRIGLRRERMDDDMFTYIETRTQLIGTDDGPGILEQSRGCAGFIIVTCPDYTSNEQVVRESEDIFTVTVFPERRSIDYSNFPVGSCRYRRI